VIPLTLRELAHKPVRELDAVGPKLEERLEIMGIATVLDVLQHYPRRWIDRTKKADIAALEIGEEATVFGEVRRVHGRRTRQGRALVEVVVSDGTSLLNLTFFNQAWREKQLGVGTEAAFFGKVESYRGKRQMTNPVVDVIGTAGGEGDKTGVIVPIYPQSGKAEVYTWQLRKVISEVLRRCAPRGLADPLDDALLDAHDLVDRNTAYRGIHQPDTMGEQKAASRRLIFDEFLRMQTGLVARKRALEADQQGIRHDTGGALVGAFHAQLPFPLTGDQRPRSPTSHATWGRPRRCTGCCRATSARARRSSRSAACSSRCRAATRARSWPPPKCSRSSTT
jgi:ATP-dependent DNA helicase RecG